MKTNLNRLIFSITNMKNKVYKDPFEYYEKVGWVKNDKGNFIDTEENENLQKNKFKIYVSY